MTRILVTIALATSAVAPAAADAHLYAGCKKDPCKRHVIQPYRAGFLGPVGACESGTTLFLRHGLRAVSAGGTYRGRYQFDLGSWQGAGGRGDPAAASWVEQAYRAVIWRLRAGIRAWPVCGRRAWA
jgi:hypothetical protein